MFPVSFNNNYYQIHVLNGMKVCWVVVFVIPISKKIIHFIR